MAAAPSSKHPLERGREREREGEKAMWVDAPFSKHLLERETERETERTYKAYSTWVVNYASEKSNVDR